MVDLSELALEMVLYLTLSSFVLAVSLQQQQHAMSVINSATATTQPTPINIIIGKSSSS